MEGREAPLFGVELLEEGGVMSSTVLDCSGVRSPHSSAAFQAGIYELASIVA
jgi:hypothetical protein